MNIFEKIMVDDDLAKEIGGEIQKLLLLPVGNMETNVGVKSPLGMARRVALIIGSKRWSKEVN